MSSSGARGHLLQVAATLKIYFGEQLPHHWVYQGFVSSPMSKIFTIIGAIIGSGVGLIFGRVTQQASVIFWI